MYIHTYIYIYIYTSSTRTRRGGSCLRVYYKTFLIYRTCMRCARARPVRACFVSKLLRCCPRTGPARDPGAMQRQVTTFLTLRTAFFTPRTPHFTLAHHLSSSHPSSSHLISCLLICQLSSSWLFSFHLRTHTRYLSSPAAATLHGKTEGFVLRLPPQNKAHSTVMQPLQCVLQQHVHIHAAITMRFASTRCRTPRENRLSPKRSKPQPPQTHKVTPWHLPVPFVTTSLRHHFLFHHPGHSHHFPWCVVTGCSVLWCNVMWCLVLWCIVMWCKVSHHPACMYCFVM